MSVVGRSVPMVDSLERVTGRVNYCLNLELPGMLTARILRSPHPHARLVRVDAARAERAPGVAAVLTRSDFERNPVCRPLYGRIYLDTPVIAIDKVRYVGDPVAAVAAVDDDAAHEALDLIEVEYEPLPAVFDAEEAARDGAPLVYESGPELRPAFTRMIRRPAGANNVCTMFRLRQGDVAAGFGESDFVFEDRYTQPAVQHVSMEPHVALARAESGHLTIWTSNQAPHRVRAELADMFGLPLTKVRVIVPTLGGGYGGKNSPGVETVVSVLAWKSGRPVKLVLDREEEFLTVTKHAVTIHMKTGVKSDGTLVARESTAYLNTGAYTDVGPMVASRVGYSVVGPYNIPHVSSDSYAVWTNLVPAGAFRGFGATQAVWACESQMDTIAQRLGMDPVELRRKNLVRDDNRYATGERLEDLHFDELLDGAVAAMDWQSRAHGHTASKRRGKGVALVFKATATPTTSTASAKLNEDGSLNVLTSSVEMGQGAKTVLAQIAAEAAAVPFEQVLVSEPDTDVTPFDDQTASSRTTFSMGTAITRAAEDVKRQVLVLASDMLETSVEDLVAQEGRVEVRGAPDRALSYGEVVRRARRGNLVGQAEFVTQGGLNPETGQGVASVHWHQGAAACEVEVDIETGKIEVVKFHSSLWAGRIINPRFCELQIEGSTCFGLGQALFEEMVYEDGQVLNRNLGDYMVPYFGDIPRRLDVAVLEREGEAEIHGVGETSLPPVMPAIANAVFDAVGVRITDLPLTPERVLRALEARRPQRTPPAELVTG